MARYSFGNTLASFFRTTPVIVEDTTAGKFDATFVSNCIVVSGGSDYIESLPPIGGTPAGTVWTHVEINHANISSGNALGVIVWINSSGTPICRLLYNASGIRFEQWSGAAWTGASIYAVMPTNLVLRRWDIRITPGGSADLYLQGALYLSTNVALANVDNICKARYYTQTGLSHFSQHMMADFDTRDSRYSCQLGLALGALTDGSGVIGDINEAVLDESTSWKLTASGQRRSATHSAFTVPTGYAIDAICIGGRGRVNGTGPTDGKFGVRKITAGVNYTNASALALNTGYEPRGRYWETDPSTATTWTQAGWNDTEFYVEGV